MEERDDLLSAAEAAERLGVKRETLYAYVSRGLLPRQERAFGRQSRFAVADVERLLEERGSRHPASAGPARAPEAGEGAGAELAIASSITRIDAGRLSYRGHDVRELAGGGAGASAASFESVAELLWTGDLVAGRPHWTASPAVLEATRSVLAVVPASAPLADRLRIATAAAAAADPLRVDLRPPAVVATARGLLVVLADSVSSRPSAGGEAPGGEPPTVAGRVAGALGVAPGWVDAIETALVVLADHELATSTLAARVAASTRADPYQVVLAGMAAVSGPLHGSASARVGRLLRAAGEPAGPERAIADELRELGVVAGFGHPQYPDGDPRAPLLLAAARAGGGDPEVLDLAAAVEAAVARRAAISPNVDFALATLVAAAGLSDDTGEALFALARTAGWLAHGLEEYAAPPLRYRLRALPVSAPTARPA